MEELQGSLAVDGFSSAVGDIFNGNAVAGVLLFHSFLSLFLPKEQIINCIIKNPIGYKFPMGFL